MPCVSQVRGAGPCARAAPSSTGPSTLSVGRDMRGCVPDMLGGAAGCASSCGGVPRRAARSVADFSGGGTGRHVCASATEQGTGLSA